MGYTTTGGQYAFPPYPPLAFMLQSGFTHTNADLVPQGGDFNSSNNWIDLAQQASAFWGGKITDHLGAFIQTTLSYDGAAPPSPGTIPTFATPIRRTSRVTTRSGAWTSTTIRPSRIPGTRPRPGPGHSSPRPSSRAPYAATLFDGPFGGLLGPGNAISAGGYVFVDDSYYAELSLYKTPSYSLQAHLGDCCATDLLGNNITFDGPAPYWRFAVEKNIGEQSIMVGTYGMLANVIPKNIAGMGTDKYWDEGFDSQYQWIHDRHAVTLRANYVIERQQFDNSFFSGLRQQSRRLPAEPEAAGRVCLRQHLRVRRRLFQYQRYVRRGHLSIRPKRGPSPNSAGWIFDVSYLPFSHGGPGVWPWMNTRIGASYTMFTKLDGLTKNVDGTPGLSASGNNTLFLYAFTMF